MTSWDIRLDLLGVSKSGRFRSVAAVLAGRHTAGGMLRAMLLFFALLLFFPLFALLIVVVALLLLVLLLVCIGTGFCHRSNFLTRQTSVFMLVFLMFVLVFFDWCLIRITILFR